MNPLPPKEPEICPEDIASVVRYLERNPPYVVRGGILQEFEDAFSRLTGTAYAVAMCNGTAAIHSALWAVGVRAGDDVIVCDYSYHGAAAAVLALGARLIPADCLPGSLTIDADDIVRAKTPGTRAILVHHPWGVPADFDSIRAAAAGIPIISDASHAHGAQYGGAPISAHSDITCFSLGPGKLITGGELGAAVSDNVVYRDRLLTYGHVNRVPDDLLTPGWNGNAVGLKFRPHALALVLARGQIARYPEKLAGTREACRTLETILRRHGLGTQDSFGQSERVYWKVAARPDGKAFAGVDTGTLIGLLQSVKLRAEPDPYLSPLQEQSLLAWPDFRDRVKRRRCQMAVEAAKRQIMFAAPSTMAENTADEISRRIGAVLNGLRGGGSPATHAEYCAQN